jgi:hypothetical protein
MNELRKTITNSDILINRLKNDFSFAYSEISDLNMLQDSAVLDFLNCRLKNIYKLKLNGNPVVSFNSKLILKFADFEEGIIVHYDSHKEYYLLPEMPKEIYIIYNEIIYKIVNYDCSLYKARVIGDNVYYNSLLNCLREVREESRIFKSLLFSFSKAFSSNVHKYISHQNEFIINYFIKYKDIFKLEDYKLLLTSLITDKRMDRDIWNSLEGELQLFDSDGKFELEVKDSDEISTICDRLYRAKFSKVDIPIERYLDIVKRANGEQYYDIRLGELCEEFVCNKTVIVDYIFQYLKFCYLKHRLKTRFSPESVRRLAFYYNEDEDTQKIFLRSYVDDEIINKEFLELFKRYINSKKVDNRTVEDSIRLILRKNDLDEEVYKIVLDFYKSNPGDYSVLEELIYRRICKGKKVRGEEYRLLYDFYKKSPVINRRRMIIALRAVKAGVKEYIELVFEYLKYEIFSSAETNGNIIFYCSEEKYKEKIFNKAAGNRNKNYLLGLGYCRRFYIENSDGEVFLYERKEFIKSTDLFLKYYSSDWDEDRKDFAAAVCVEEGIFNETILREQIKNNGQYAMSAYEMIMKNTASLDPEAAAELFKEYCSKFEGKLDSSRVINFIANLNKQDIGVTVDLVSYMDNTLSTINYGQLCKIVINKAVGLGYYVNLNYLIHKAINDIGDEGRLAVDVLSYVNNVPLKGHNRIILELFAKIYASGKANNELKMAIENRIMSTSANYGELDILYRIYSSGRNKVLKDFIVSISLDRIKENSEEINKLIIEKYESQPQLLKGILTDMNMTEGLAEKIYHILRLDSNNYPFMLNHLEMLKKIEAHNEEANKTYKKMIDITNTVHKYYIDKSLEYELGIMYRVHDIYTGDKASLLLVEDNTLLKCLQIYDRNNSRQKPFMKEVEGYVLLQGLDLSKSYRDIANINEVLRVLSDILSLQVLLKSEGYILPNLEVKDILMIDDTPFPKYILEVYEYMGFVRYEEEIKYPISRKKEYINKNAAFIDLYEKDLVEILVHLAFKLLKDSKVDFKGITKYFDGLKSEEIETIEQLKAYVDNLIYQVEVSEKQKQSLQEGIEYFIILDEDARKDITSRIVEEDRSSANAFGIVLENYKYCVDINKTLHYLLSNFDNNFTDVQSRKIAKNIFNIIKENETYTEAADRKLKSLISRFMARAEEEKLFRTSKHFGRVHDLK